VSLYRSLQHRARTSTPGLYRRVRNAAWLARWYGWGPAADEPGTDPYGDAFWDRNEAGDWDGFARATLSASPARSVLDVGCGSGAWLRGVVRVAPETRVLGLEHSPDARRRAQAAGLDVRPFDATALGGGEAGRLASELGAWDLVSCLEVAEHLPPWHGARLVRLLAHWDTVLFSAARPGQGGVWHLNEQPPEYWLQRFARHGLRPDPATETLRASLPALDLAPWYKNNVVLLTRRSGARTAE
jgi:SAM-dependent methyltransferase